MTSIADAVDVTSTASACTRLRSTRSSGSACAASGSSTSTTLISRPYHQNEQQPGGDEKDHEAGVVSGRPHGGGAAGRHRLRYDLLRRRQLVVLAVGRLRHPLTQRWADEHQR